MRCIIEIGDPWLTFIAIKKASAMLASQSAMLMKPGKMYRTWLDREIKDGKVILTYHRKSIRKRKECLN